MRNKSKAEDPMKDDLAVDADPESKGVKIDRTLSNLRALYPMEKGFTKSVKTDK